MTARPIRRLGNLLFGHAPWRVRPFDAVMPTKRPSRRPDAPKSDLSQGVVERVGVGDSLRRELWLLSPGGIIGNAGIVYDPESRTAIRETVLDWHLPAERHPVLSAPRFPKARALAGLSLAAVTLSAEGFWHFLLEALPKIQIAAAWRQRIRHLLVNGPPTPWKQRWLERAGFSPEQIVWMEGLSHYHCEQLLCSPPLVADCQPSAWGVRAVRELLRIPPAPAVANRKIWASRRDAASRQPVWENEVLDRLPDWERVEFSGRTADETISICRAAAALAGPHGANLANAVFLPPGACLCELYPRESPKPLFQRLAAAAQLRYQGRASDFNRPDEAAAIAADLAAMQPARTAAKPEPSPQLP